MPTPESYDACDKKFVKKHYYGKKGACKKHVECNFKCSSVHKRESDGERRCKKRCERIHTGTGQGDDKEEKKRDRAYKKASEGIDKNDKVRDQGKKKDRQANERAERYNKRELNQAKDELKRMIRAAEREVKKEKDKEDIEYYLGALGEQLRGTRRKKYTNKERIENGRNELDKRDNFNIEMPNISSMFGKYAWYQDKTSEPIPDYIMRSLKPKKSVHPEYGKLRY